MGLKASEDFPDPDSPVKTTSLSRGMMRSTSFRLCSRAPRMTISVCCPTAFFNLPTDPGPHATALRSVPLPRLGGGRRRQGVSIFHRIPTQRHQAVAQFGGALELQVAGGLLHLTLEVFDQPLDLVWRQPGRQGGDRIFDGLRLLPLEVVDGLDDGRWRDAVLLVVGDLDIAAALSLIHGTLHRAADAIGVEDDVPFDVASRTSNR